jgi:cation diffusion facilitator CzcD-associated flavoprotein CzcO
VDASFQVRNARVGRSAVWQPAGVAASPSALHKVARERSQQEVNMTNAQGSSPAASAKKDFDAIIIGAGFSGMYMLHSLRDKLDLNVTVFEAGDGVGGTWYWNRYPGARCDSDSYIYCYTFDKNLLQEWNWSERYPEQDEILRYLEHCAERFDLKPDIQFGKRIVEVTFDEDTELWTRATLPGHGS